jgi:hypothetical protein
MAEVNAWAKWLGFGLGVLAAALAGFFIGVSEARAGAVMSAEESVVVGDELRVIVRTYEPHQPLMSHSSVSSDVKGWVVLVVLGKTGPLAKRSRVLGPVWDVPGARSSISLEAGATYSKEDVEAQRATPRVMFDEEGQVMRLRLTADGKGVEKSVLDVRETGAVWWKDAAYTRIPNRVGWTSGDYVQTRTKKYHLQYADGKAGLYETNTGKAVPDRWLENVMEQVCGEPGQGKMKMILTEDLKYLVVNPAPLNVDGEFVKTFRIAGKEYSRAEYWVYWERAHPEPVLVKKEAGKEWREMGKAQGYVDAFSIDGRLWLLADGEQKRSLVTVNGDASFEIAVPGDDEWKFGMPPIHQHREKEGKLIMVWRKQFQRAKGNRANILCVVEWDYLKKTLVQKEVVLDELFEEKGGAFVPVEGVEEGGRKK